MTKSVDLKNVGGTTHFAASMASQAKSLRELLGQEGAVERAPESLDPSDLSLAIAVAGQKPMFPVKPDHIWVDDDPED